MRLDMKDWLILVRRRIGQIKWLSSALERRQKTRFAHLRREFYDQFWKEAAHNIGADIERLGYGYHRITKAGKWTLVNDAKVMLDDSLIMAATENKPLINQFLREIGCPFPRFVEYDLKSLAKAREFLRSLRGPAVVKPAGGTAGGLGVTSRILDENRLIRASCHASIFQNSLMIEEEIPGHCYRLLYLDGKLIDAIRRDPPAVTGDGRRNLRQLMEDETEQRLRQTHPCRSLIPLSLDLTTLFYLQDQGLTPAYVPKAQERVVVKSIISQNAWNENHVVRNEVHPSIEELGSRLVNALGIRLAGLDLITRAIDVPLEESGGVLNEINIPPGLHYHALVSDPGKKYPIGEKILETILSGPQRSGAVKRTSGEPLSHASR